MVESELLIPHITSIEIAYSDRRNLRRVPQRSVGIIMQKIHQLRMIADNIFNTVRIADFSRGYVEECCEVSFSNVKYGPYVTDDGSVGLRKK